MWSLGGIKILFRKDQDVILSELASWCNTYSVSFSASKDIDVSCPTLSSFLNLEDSGKKTIRNTGYQEKAIADIYTAVYVGALEKGVMDPDAYAVDAVEAYKRYIGLTGKE